MKFPSALGVVYLRGVFNNISGESQASVVFSAGRFARLQPGRYLFEEKKVAKTGCRFIQQISYPQLKMTGRSDSTGLTVINTDLA
ncbi:hypothetical protein MJD09_21190 [bacterium]|nr:hypothetical protein [bacterium]